MLFRFVAAAALLCSLTTATAEANDRGYYVAEFKNYVNGLGRTSRELTSCRWGLFPWERNPEIGFYPVPKCPIHVPVVAQCKIKLFNNNPVVIWYYEIENFDPRGHAEDCYGAPGDATFELYPTRLWFK